MYMSVMEILTRAGAGKACLELLEEARCTLEQDEDKDNEDEKKNKRKVEKLYLRLHRLVLKWAMNEGAGSGTYRAGLLPRLLELRPSNMAPMDTLNFLQEVVTEIREKEATEANAEEGEASPERLPWRVGTFRDLLLHLAR